jgi:hypothetical protein
MVAPDIPLPLASVTYPDTEYVGVIQLDKTNIRVINPAASKRNLNLVFKSLPPLR